MAPELSLGSSSIHRIRRREKPLEAITTHSFLAETRHADFRFQLSRRQKDFLELLARQHEGEHIALVHVTRDQGPQFSRQFPSSSSICLSTATSTTHLTVSLLPFLPQADDVDDDDDDEKYASVIDWNGRLSLPSL